MKILVAGRTGQVAQSFVLRGLASSHQITAMGRPGLDITQPGAVTQIIEHVQPDIILNAAAYTAVDAAEDDEATAFSVNAHGAMHIAEAAQESGAILIHLSTDYVFDGGLSRPYEEADATRPLNVYGRSKLEGEARIVALGGHYLIMRTGWVYSPFGRNFVKTMLGLASRRKEITVVDDQTGSPTYALHLADALLGMCEKLAAGLKPASGIYHLAGQGHASWAELAQSVFTESKDLSGPFATVKPIPSSDYPVRALRPGDSRLATDKVKAVFGLELPPWQDGVRDCVRRLAALGAWPEDNT